MLIRLVFGVLLLAAPDVAPAAAQSVLAASILIWQVYRNAESPSLHYDPNHVWGVVFVHDKLSNGRRKKILTVLDQ